MGALAVSIALLALSVAGCGVAQDPKAPAAGAGDGQAEAAAQDAVPKPDPNQVKPLPGYRAPDLVARDVFTGEAVRLADLRGKVVMLNFWATWCPPCRVEMPHMEEFHQQAGDEVVILAVGGDGREAPEKLAAFAREMGLSFTIAYDGGIGLQRYQVLGLPTSFFIDQHGIIRSRVTRALTLEQMAELAEEARKLGQTAVES